MVERSFGIVFFRRFRVRVVKISSLPFDSPDEEDDEEDLRILIRLAVEELSTTDLATVRFVVLRKTE